VLSFDGEPHGVVVVHPVLVPQSLEEIEAEIATKRLLDDLTVPLSLTSCPHSDPAKYVFVESYCGPHLSHLCIIAYRCSRAKKQRKLGPPGNSRAFGKEVVLQYAYVDTN
jgi:hypothetical protein